MFFNINLKYIFSRLRGDPLQKSACWANKLCLGQKLIRSHVSVVFLNLFRRRSFHASENCSRPRAISFKNVMSQFFPTWALDRSHQKSDRVVVFSSNWRPLDRSFSKQRFVDIFGCLKPALDSVWQVIGIFLCKTGSWAGGFEENQQRRDRRCQT